MKRILWLTAFLAATAYAQQWARPARTPNTDVVCKGCPDKANGKLTPGYPNALGVYLGRFLDSSASSDCQKPVRSFRADHVLPMPALNRVYFQIGSAVMAYDLGAFFQRVGANESLVANDRSRCFTQIADTVLQWDQWYYAELEPINEGISSSGWDVAAGGDGQTRLYGFDVDDQGYVYIATKWYRWGIVKDDRRRDGSLMQFIWQAPPTADAVIPVTVVTLRGSGGAQYAVISDGVGSTLNVYDVADRTHPVKRANLPKSMYRYAKNSDSTRVAIATVDGRMEIYATDSFIAGGAPLFTRSDESMIQAVASDGTNFYGAAVKSAALVLSSYVPDGATYRKVVDYSPAPRATISVENLRYGAGYLTAAGFVDGSYELRLFKVTQ
jgi:hypothetical protein